LPRCFLSESFEANQSFPKIRYTGKKINDGDAISLNALRASQGIESKNPTTIKTMDKIKLDGINGLRFTPYRKKGCFNSNSISPYSCSLFNPKSGINPNKVCSFLFMKKKKINNLKISNRPFLQSTLKHHQF
jgi:hypothetical protein